jgi:hypothetical protein
MTRPHNGAWVLLTYKIGRNLKINDKSAAKLYRWALAEKVLQTAQQVCSYSSFHLA